MAFSSVFVVTNSLRLRGYDVRKLSPAKPLARQLGDLAPRLLLPAAALVVLVAISIGWLQPVQAKEHPAADGGTRKTTTYRAFIDQKTPIMPGQPTRLDIKILDQFGKPFTDFDLSPFGQTVNFRIASRDLKSLAASSQPLNPGGGGGSMGMGGGTASGPAVNPKGTPIPTPTPVAAFQQQTVFPTEGQYVVFVDFWPRGGAEEVVTAPIIVGSAQKASAALTPDATTPRTVGDLKLMMKTDGPLKANEYNYITFDVTDAQGQPRSDQIQMLCGDLCQLDIIDEGLTVFLRPDFVNRHKLQYSVFFPKPGRYKAWFTFYYADSTDLGFTRATSVKFREFYIRSHPNQLVRLPFVIEVE
jgi:hypothetical protein